MLAVPEDYSHDRAMKEVKKALTMLVSRAKLETILKASIEAGDGADMCEKKKEEEKTVEKNKEAVEETPKDESVKEESTEEATDEAVQKEEQADPAPAPEASPNSEILQALQAMDSKIDALATENKTTQEEVQKMKSAFRAPSNGGTNEETVQKSDNPFDGFGPFSVLNKQ
jgi:hypothetical protein